MKTAASTRRCFRVKIGVDESRATASVPRGAMPMKPRARVWRQGQQHSGYVSAQLRVPPAFVLGFPLFSDFTRTGALGDSLEALIDENLAELERQSGRRIGDSEHPLLVSIRPGAPMSMPGVMATILNVGISPSVRRGIEDRRGGCDDCVVSALPRELLYGPGCDRRTGGRTS